MRLFKQLCGNDRLSNVVVVTTRWDEVCHDEDAVNEAQNSETCLMEAEGLLKELNDAGVPFLRSGHFGPQAVDPSVQPPEERYSTPSAVVHSLLGLEPVYLKIQEQMGQGKSIRETDAGMVLEDFKALKLEINERIDTIQRNLDSLNSATDPKAWEDLQKVSFSTSLASHSVSILFCSPASYRRPYPIAPSKARARTHRSPR